MARVWTFTLITIGMMFLLAAGGIPTTSGYILGMIGFNTGTLDWVNNFQTGGFYGSLLTLMAILAGVSAVVIGIFGSQQTDLPIRGTIATTILILFIGDTIATINYASLQATYLGWVVTLLFFPLVLGYILALVDWIGGKD